MKETLITGHKGLIGGALYGNFGGVGFDRGDEWVDQDYGLIIHAAANCSIREVIRQPDLAKENIDLTYRVFELARRQQSKLVVFSSGRVGHESYNPYTVSKRFVENMARAYKDCYGVDCLVIRPETVWGRSNNNERVVIKWIQAANENRPLFIYGPKDKELPPIYIDQFTEIVTALIQNFEMYKNQVISVSGQVRKAIDIAQAILDLTGSTSEIIFREGELTQPQNCDPADFQSQVPFEESLRKYLCS